ncbi:hypothetical protein [Burkholderia cenocepacia]|uniref:hypothetical protein n=1 Tax=Burkholderia cenocepacia TaxID=95486 RepID=UPI0012B530ED|nr:hypothetical protein [Burkholderia cenocepacia]
MDEIEGHVERSGAVCAIRNRRHDGLKFARRDGVPDGRLSEATKIDGRCDRHRCSS